MFSRMRETVKHIGAGPSSLRNTYTVTALCVFGICWSLMAECVDPVSKQEVRHARNRRTAGSSRDGPPVKPDHFRSVAELNKYLADLNEYYTVLGRPRLAETFICCLSSTTYCVCTRVFVRA
jgi:hypothetical protein